MDKLLDRAIKIAWSAAVLLAAIELSYHYLWR
jgi:hypothetical protein